MRAFGEAQPKTKTAQPFERFLPKAKPTANCSQEDGHSAY